VDEPPVERILRGRRLGPDLLTLSRPAIGAAAGLAVAAGQGGLGGWLYLVSYLTDVADGLLARALGVNSPAGQRLDGICDLIAMYAIGLGLVVRAMLDGTWVVVVLVAIVAIGGDLLDRFWVPAHTVVGKALGGLTRIGTFGMFVYFARPSQRPVLVVAGALVFVSTFSYEAVVTWREMRSGDRPVR